MPGARNFMIEIVSSMPAPIAATSATLSPSSQKSIASPGEYWFSVSGT